MANNLGDRQMGYSANSYSSKLRAAIRINHSHIQRNTSFYTAAIKQEWRHTRTGEMYRAELDKPELKKPRGVSPLIFN